MRALLLLALLLFVPVAPAIAGTCSKSYSLSVDDGCANEGEAAMAAFAAARGRVDAGNPSYPDWVVCGLTNDPPPAAVAVKICMSPTNSTGVAAYTRYYNNTCSSLGETPQSTIFVNGTMQCSKGCEVRYFNDNKNPPTKVTTGRACDVWDYKCPPGYVQGGATAWSQGSINCLPDGPPECPTGTRLEEGKCVPDQQCPNGQHIDAQGKCSPKKEECPAGQTKGPDGSCVDDGKCPAGQTRGQDGSCKKDGDGDGEPDPGEDDGKFSGGDDCKNPPQCSGDNILCGQARIQWRIDCNTRRNENITGGACNAMPVCTGERCNATEYASLLQMWRMRCALERMEANSGSTPGGPGGGTVSGGESCDVAPACSGDALQCAQIRQQWKARCEAASRSDKLALEASQADTSNGSTGHESDSIWGADISETFQPDTGGLGWGASCPAPPQIFGKTLDLGGMCNLMHMLGAIILAVAFAHAMYILMGD